MTPESPWLTTTEAVKYLKVSKSKLYSLIRDGKLTPYTAGGVTRYRRDDLDGVFTPVIR